MLYPLCAANRYAARQPCARTKRKIFGSILLRTFLTADDRVEKVAAYVAEHFKENVLPLGYKAFWLG